MKILLDNQMNSMKFCLSYLRILGFLVPGTFSPSMRIIMSIYWIICFLFIVGIYIIVQVGDLIQIWGDVDLMTSTSFLLITNFTLGMKIINVVIRGSRIQSIIEEADDELKSEDRPEGKAIVDRCNWETSQFLYLYSVISFLTVCGWVASAEPGSLPQRAWYPFDENTTPAYQITYTHQSVAVAMGATLNISLDTLVTTLIALCRCRLRLLGLSLETLCNGIVIRDLELLSSEEEKTIMSRLKVAVKRHHSALRAAVEIQNCFSEPIFAQFSVSALIICASAYSLAAEIQGSSLNFFHLMGMIMYILAMLMQVFIYSYQGNQLQIESSDICQYAYKCPWYQCSSQVRSALLLIMARTQRVAKITAGGFTTLSLLSFTAIVKGSYTFFTVLQCVDQDGE